MVRVLLIDDDRDDYEIARDLLDEIGDGRRYEVDWIRDYEQASHALTHGDYHVCLLDYFLGASDGLGLLADAVRAANRIPVIFMTGRGDTGVEHRALAAGAADYLVKGEISAETLGRSIRHSVERGRGLEALRAREHQFRSVFEASLDAMLIADDEGRYIDGNDAALSLLGVTRAQLVALSVADVAPPEARDDARAAWQTVMREGRGEGELRLRRPDGSDRTVEFRTTTHITPGRHLSVLRDVTERRSAEEQRVRLAAMVESAADAIEGVALDGTIDYWGAAAERMYGYAAAEVLGRPKAILVPADRAAELEGLFDRVRTGDAVRDHETVRRRKDGSIFVASVTVSPVRRSGRLAAFSVITRDVSEKKKLEAHLAVSDRMASVGTLAAGVAHEINNPLAAVIANLEYLGQAFADAAADRRAAPTAGCHSVTLYDSDEALTASVLEYLVAGAGAGEPVIVVATEPHRELFVAALRRCNVDVDGMRASGALVLLDAREALSTFMVAGVPDAELFAREIGGVLQSALTRSGAAKACVYGEMVDLLVADGAPRAAARLEELWNDLTRLCSFSLFCAYDTARFQSADDVRRACASHTAVSVSRERSPRSEANVGSWLRERTHEISEEIARQKAIGARVELPNMRSLLEAVREPLADAQLAAERVRHVVRDLRLFSRADEETRGPVDLQSVLESSSRMAWNEIRHRARLVKDYAPIPAVDGSESRLGQVFLNLIVNAAQAIREGAAEQNEIRLVTRTDGDGRVVAEVSDTGAGIAPDALGRLFDPFFTTKPAGVGTGLGLSICRRIVHDLGGMIEVASAPGKGTTFRVTLPAARPELASAPPVRPTAAMLPARRGRVLVIDDEPLITQTLRRLLGPHHDVTCAVAAMDALEQLRAGAEFDVIPCDMMMPQMTGMDFYDALAKLRPEHAVRVVFLSGGAFTPGSREFLARVSNEVVEKPFAPKRLREVIDERIASAARPKETPLA